MYTSRMRMTGSSGMDIDSIVTDLMKAESQRLYKAKRESILLTWRQEAYRGVAKKLTDFKATYFDLLGPKKMHVPSTYKNFTSSVQTSSGVNSDAIKVTTNSSAMEGEYKVAVMQLATSASVTGSQKVVSSKAAEGSDSTRAEDLLKAVKEANAVKGNKIEKWVPIPDLTEDGKQKYDVDGKPMYLYEEEQAEDDQGNPLFHNDDPNDPIMVPVQEKDADGEPAVDEKGQPIWKLKMEKKEVGEEKGFIFSVTYDGVTKGIDLSDIPHDDESYTTANLVDDINKKLEAAFGKEYVDTATAEQIAKGEGDNNSSLLKPKMSISLDEDTGDITFAGSTRKFTISGLGDAGIANGTSNAVNTSASVSSLLGSSTRELSINNEKIAITSGMTVKNLMDAINSSDAGVKMSFDSVNQCFKIASNTTGEQSSIVFNNDATKDAMSKVFGMSGTDTEDGYKLNNYTKGTDAIIRVNGKTVQSSTNTVKLDSENGVILNLTNTTVEKDDEGKVTKVNELTINIKKDNDKLLNNIKDFIKAYNELIEGFQTDLKTARPKSDKYSYYEPLLDEEKEGLSDSEIAKMEEKGKTGLLRSDPILSGIVNGMRNATYTSIDVGNGKKLSLFNIGITTSSDTSKGAMLEIDEDKLKEAIEKHGDDIATLFAGSGEGDKEIFGVADLIDKEIVKATHWADGTLTQRAGIEGRPSATDNYYYHILKEKNERIESMLDSLAKKEDAYYKKFSAMEQAMNASQSQMSSMMSQLGM